MTNVRFSHDKSHIISTGGGDHAVFLWKFNPGEIPADDEDDTGHDTGG